jgi:hypothetical protein
MEIHSSGGVVVGRCRSRSCHRSRRAAMIREDQLGCSCGHRCRVVWPAATAKSSGGGVTVLGLGFGVWGGSS